ncbi:MAG: DUF5082 family protein [Hespellia sp.]|nr:DUF5082 family protein [Hespellia sp.]
MSKERNQAAIDTCNQRIRNCRSQIVDNQTQVNNLNSKITRLETAVLTLSSQKESLDSQSVQVRTAQSDFTDWKGENRIQYTEQVNSLDSVSFQAYKIQTNHAHTGIKEELSRLIEQKISLEDQILSLQNQILDWSNDLEDLMS